MIEKILGTLARIPVDKLLHLTVNLVAVSVLLALVKLVTNNLLLQIAVPSGILLIIDIWKELWYDKIKGRGNAEWGDLVFGIIGIILGLSIGLIN